MQERFNKRMKLNSENLEDAILSQNLDRCDKQISEAGSSRYKVGRSHIKKCISETALWVLGQEKRKRNEDWYYDRCISIGQEKIEARMKLLNRNTRQNRELYKQKRKETYRLYRRKKKKKIKQQYRVTFRGPCIVIYSYNKSQRDALFLKFILMKNST
jgi:hypothetical protein